MIEGKYSKENQNLLSDSYVLDTGSCTIDMIKQSMNLYDRSFDFSQRQVKYLFKRYDALHLQHTIFQEKNIELREELSDVTKDKKEK